MSPHIAVFAPATRVMSRKLGPTWRSASPCSSSRPAACEASTFASTCGQVAEHGHEAVVRLGVHRHRPRPNVHHEAVQPLVEQPARLLVRRQVPDGALEEVGAGVLHARGLGARDRMAAHEARVGRARHEVLLRRAHVGDERVRPRGVKRRAHQLGQHADRRAGEAELGPLDGLGDRGRGALMAPRSTAVRSRSGSRPNPTTSASSTCSSRRQADRAADQPHAEDGYPHACVTGRS